MKQIGRWLGSTALLVGTPLAAQEVPLGPATAVHPADFAVVNSVRELPDGRVFVADPMALVFVLIDADLQRADTLGSEGEGPDEYRQPDAVWPLPGDSTLLVDLGNARLTAVGPDGGFGGTAPMTLGGGAAGAPPAVVIPGGVDGRGRIHFAGMPEMTAAGPSDSVTVLRLTRDGAPETVARVKTTSYTSNTSGSADNRSVDIRPVPLSATDVWAASGDGSLFVARAGERRVERIGPDGSTVRGAAVDMAPVPIRRAEMEEWAADRQTAGGGIGIQITEVNGRRSMSMQRGGGPDPDLDGFTWPDAKAPWVANSGSVDGEGRFWVRRSRPAGEAALYDVFGADGNHRGAVRFPCDRTLVGFGADALYAVHVDPFDLKVLERYPLPDLR